MDPLALPLVDCHAHLYPPNFESDEIDAIVLQAERDQVSAIVVVPEFPDDIQTVQMLAKKNAVIHAAVGLHPVQKGPLPTLTETPIAPHQPRSIQLSEFAFLEALDFSALSRVVCIGECGLDYSPHILNTLLPIASVEQQKEVQAAVFQKHIDLAKSQSLPLNIHSRSAGHYAVDMVIQNNVAASSLLHAFDGKPSHALQACSHGAFFSVAPIVVRSPHLQKLVKELPLTNLVLETDAPALGPEKGVPNHPSNLALAACEIAKIKGIPVAQVAQITTENAHRLFRMEK
ncbi:putative deoxyribonuclease TATDN3-like protein [Polychytrium aggregatum]|uniref:putative deoxyribonuclease TATDN3-like protein n=1 Tax=Polychytrium aggregatum TaxID=110093 RepID=UPI0022FF302D|nr:putative deoxyribonuclease TATDN3-like protein [Polychytrium aggregatum]KAI9203363.1 putative deoxyribonuclease TATDN3-like protein [Polychytrium aggregatum]